MTDVNKFESMQIGLTSPGRTRSWSYREVKKPETIDYRALKPEKQGLSDERIFSPTKNYERACRKYKRIRYKGRVCGRCGVEVTSAKVRRKQMGHIELAAPISHVWYFKGIPSRMGLVLDMSPRSLEEAIYFTSYAVLDPGDTPLEKKQLLTEAEYHDKKAEYSGRFKAEMGAATIQELLADADLEEGAAELKEKLKEATGQKRTHAIRRLDIFETFIKSGNKPKWMVMDVVPVMPPDLRPMVQPEGGRSATSNLSDLYQQIINRSNRLKRLFKLRAPGIIVQNEKRVLQKAADALIDNGRRGRPVAGPDNRPLKSLSHLLKGKQGRFRQNLLGKRVDYSGRSVIDVDPLLRLNQMGLPVPMAPELLKPFTTHELVKHGLSANVKVAKRKIDYSDDDVSDISEGVIKEHPVLLNRTPTLHQLGVQVFEPILVSGKSMRLHLLVCSAYNADFDGDQMTIHVPLSDEAQAEARLLILTAHHIPSPRDGKLIVSPPQGMAIGNYYMTIEDKGREGEGMIFKDTSEAKLAYRNDYVSLQARVGVQVSAFPEKPFTDGQRGKIMVTTVGKLPFNRIIPRDLAYIDEPADADIQNGVDDCFFLGPSQDIHGYLENAPLVPPFKKGLLSDSIVEVCKRYEATRTSQFLDRIKDLGCYESTISGLTTTASDIHDLPERSRILDKAQKQVALIAKQFRRSLITDDGRYERAIGAWNDVKDEVQDKSIEHMDIRNPINMMSDPGTRGNISNFAQLAGMRGLMASPNGKVMELPVKSNFCEGLSVLEMFISLHDTRKGVTDTALKTANSGYLTRRLVDIVRDVVIRERDCGADRGLEVTAITNDNEMIEPLYDRIMGCYTMKSVFDSKAGEKIVGKNVLVDEEMTQKIVDAGIKKVIIRSAFTCSTEHGVCERCYGRNAATGDRVEAGKVVGTVTTQSIDEPDTQLTLRNFHTGGIVGSDDTTQGLPCIQEIVEVRNLKGRAAITEVTGEVTSVGENPAEQTKDITTEDETGTRTYTLPIIARMKAAEDDFIHHEAPLNEGSIDPKELIQVRDALSTKTYLLSQVQGVYRIQGIDLLDKHVEVMIRQMVRKARIVDPGDTDFLPGRLMDINQFRDTNEDTLVAGDILAAARPVILSITKATLETSSFPSAASFQETTRVLTDVAIRSKNDPLVGLKENIIAGKIIPTGTGMSVYRDIKPKEVNIAAYSIKDIEARLKEEDKQS